MNKYIYNSMYILINLWYIIMCVFVTGDFRENLVEPRWKCTRRLRRYKSVIRKKKKNARSSRRGYKLFGHVILQVSFFYCVFYTF